jgi:hypothetical protein
MLIRDPLGEGLLASLAPLLLCVVAVAQKQPPAKPTDLNAATIKELEELPGVGRLRRRGSSRRARKVVGFAASRTCSRYPEEASRSAASLRQSFSSTFLVTRAEK